MVWNYFCKTKGHDGLVKIQRDGVISPLPRKLMTVQTFTINTTAETIFPIVAKYKLKSILIFSVGLDVQRIGWRMTTLIATMPVMHITQL